MELVQLPFFGESQQPARVHFKRKFSVTPLGIFDEVEQTGVLYLYSQLLGKPNTNHIISILEIAINQKRKHQRRRNRVLRLNFDNCAVQKCYLMIAYACYLVKKGIYDVVEVHFRIAGHTKFSPDRMFAYFSELFKKLDLFEVEDLVDAWMAEFVVSQGNSSYSVVSLDEIVDGKSTYFSDYKEYFKDHFKAFNTLNACHLFQVSLLNGKVAVATKEFSTDPDWQEVPFWNETINLKEGLQKLPLVPLNEAKLKDLRDCLSLIPAGKLSYVP